MSAGYPPGPQGGGYDEYGLTPRPQQPPAGPPMGGSPSPGVTPPPPASAYSQATPYEPTFVGPAQGGYSGQPGSSQPGFGQPGAGQQGFGGQPGGFQPGSVPPPPAKKKSSVGLIIGIIAGVLVMALVAVIVVVVFIVNNKPDDAVKKYFAALAAGNATEALSYAETEPIDKTLLTDEVLRKSNELGAISDVKITRSSKTLVEVSMRVGTTTKTATYRVNSTSKGWKLVDVAWKVPIVTTSSSTAPLIINGVKAENVSSAYVFPGSYELTTGSKNLAWKESKQVFVGGMLSVPASVSLVITEDGKSAAKSAISKLFSECTAGKSFTPKRADGGNCPFVLRTPKDGADVSTIRWSIDTDPANTWVPSFSTDPTKVSGPLVYSIKLQYNYTANGQTYTASGTSVLTQTFIADLTTDPVKVTWR